MDGYPRMVPVPAPADTVQVVMSERMARRFEALCLGARTVAPTALSGPVLFSERDLPTYIIGLLDDSPMMSIPPGVAPEAPWCG